MGIDIHLTLSDEDLIRLRQGLDLASRRASSPDADTVITAARRLWKTASGGPLPEFVRDRLKGLETLIDMAADAGFALPDDEHARVLAVLAYFAEPDDAIPDGVPVLGYLDDALMVELSLLELQHEIDAYEDFRDWREREARLRGEDLATLHLDRVEWAEARRLEAIERMRRQREESYVSGGWSPVLFKVH